MKNTKSLSKLLTIILSVMMIFSSVLVTNANNIYATDGSEEEIKEILEEKEEDLENKEETPAESEKQNDSEGETTNKVEETPEQPEVEEEIIEEENDLSQLSAFTTMPTMGNSLGSSPTITRGNVKPCSLFNPCPYTLTFHTVDSRGKYIKYDTPNGVQKLRKNEYPLAVPEPEPIHFHYDENGEKVNDEIFVGWYERFYLFGQLIKESFWDDFDKSSPKAIKDSEMFILDTIPIGFSIDLYPKFESTEINYEDYFDFKVDNGNGSFVKKDENGKEWSYYSYYKNENNLGIVDLLDAIININNPSEYVLDYNYVISNDQVMYETVDSASANDYIELYDTNHDGKVDQKIDTNGDGYYNSLDFNHIGDPITIVKTENGKSEIQIGSYSQGTAFDLAIQEADPNNTIVLLPHKYQNGQLFNRDFYIVKPIEIWGNIDFDLNGCTLYYNENSKTLGLLHDIDRKLHNCSGTTGVFSKDIAAAIYVNNAKSKIFSSVDGGKIISAHTYGTGVLATSYDTLWTVTLENVDIDVKSGQNAVESGYYKIVGDGNVTSALPGYVTINSGKYDGYLVRNGEEGYLKINGGSDFTKNPELLNDNTSSNGVEIAQGYEVWDNGNTASYRYSVDIAAQASIGEKKYKTIEAAITDAKAGDTIKLEKDLILPEGSIYSITKSITFNVNGKNIRNGCIEIDNGAQVSFVGSGYIYTNINSLNGKLFISGSGYYDKITNLVRETGEIVGEVEISGGLYANALSENFIKSGYVVISSDMAGYPYEVVLESEKCQVSLYKNINNVTTRVVEYVEVLDGETWKKVSNATTAPSSPTSGQAYFNNDTYQLYVYDGSSWNLTNVDNTTYRYHYFDETYYKLATVMTAIKYDYIDVDKIVLNRDCTINDPIEITEPIEIDLNGKTITSTVKPSDDKRRSEITEIVEDQLAYVATIYVNIKNGETNRNVKITNGYIDNISDAGTATVYGVYNANGNITIDNGTTLTMSCVSCSKYFGIYNASNSSTVNINEYSMIYGISNSKEATLVYSLGNVNVDAASLYIYADSKTEKLTAIDIRGAILNVSNESLVLAQGIAGEAAEAYGIRATGNVYIDNSIINATSSNSNAYGIYAPANVSGINKEIVVDNNSTISVEKQSKYSNAKATVYGIYTEPYESIENGLVNIAIGKGVFFNVDSLNAAYGISSEGGNVYAGTINGSAKNIALNNGFNIKKNSYDENGELVIDVENVPDSIESVNDCATIKIKGAEESIGVWCGFVDNGKYNQLTNTLIYMNSDSADSYCVSADSTKNGVDVLGGYYHSKTGNILNGRSYAGGGKYSHNVEDHLLLNNKIKEINENVTSNKTGLTHHMAYEIVGSECQLLAKVFNEDELKVKIYVSYDSEYLQESNRLYYGIKFTIGNLQPQVFTIKDSIDALAESQGQSSILVDEETQFIYSFCIPAKNIVDNIKIEIISLSDLVEENVIHRVSSYSVQTYYYNMLTNSKNPNTRDLAAVSLNYATYAQIYFNYCKTNLANKNLGLYTDLSGINYNQYFTRHIDDIDVEELLAEIPFDLNDILDKTGHSMILEGSSTLRYHFGLKENLDNLTFTLNDVEIKPTHDSVAGRYYIDIAGIAAGELNKSYEIEVTKIDGENKKVYRVLFSPIDFIINATGDGAGEALSSLMNAYYQYYEIARKFINE